ncbi:MAG: DUF2079 domain-containing protein, partial [Pyrobaculum sp.]
MFKPLLYIAIYIIAFGGLSILRHKLFYSYAYDLGIFVQALYTTWRGYGLLYETPDSMFADSYLGIHFSPILLLLVPLFALFPHAET